MHKDWQAGRVLGIFFESDEALMVVCQDGSLCTVDARSGAVSVHGFVKVCPLQSPLSTGLHMPQGASTAAMPWLPCAIQQRTVLCTAHQWPRCVQGQMASPLCCAFDPVYKTLVMAGRGSSRADQVCLALWQVAAGAPPHLLGRCGRPARQGLFGRREQPSPAWTLSLDAQASMCLVAAGGDQLHVFRWKASPLTAD